MVHWREKGKGIYRTENIAWCGGREDRAVREVCPHRIPQVRVKSISQQKSDIEIVAAGQRQDPGTQVNVSILLD